MSRQNKTLFVNDINLDIINDPYEVLYLFTENENLIDEWNGLHPDKKVYLISYNEILLDQLNQLNIDVEYNRIYFIIDKYVIFNILNDTILPNIILKFIRFNGLYILRLFKKLDNYGNVVNTIEFYSNGFLKKEYNSLNNKFELYNLIGDLIVDGTVKDSKFTGKAIINHNIERFIEVPISYIYDTMNI